MRNYRKFVQLEAFEYIETSFLGNKWNAKILICKERVGGLKLLSYSWLFGKDTEKVTFRKCALSLFYTSKPISQ